MAILPLIAIAKSGDLVKQQISQKDCDDKLESDMRLDLLETELSLHLRDKDITPEKFKYFYTLSMSSINDDSHITRQDRLNALPGLLVYCAELLYGEEFSDEVAKLPPLQDEEHDFLTPNNSGT